MSLLDKLPKSLPKLSSIPFFSKQETAEYYFALTISFTKVTAAVWGIERGKLEIISSSTQSYHSTEELTDAANFALDEALGAFQPEPEQVLFGVPESWLQDENIKPEYLTVLKKMVKELGLSPMAYVSTAHAVSHLLQKQQGSPIGAVLVEQDNPITVSVVKGGKIVASKKHKRSGDLPEDVEKALASFSDIEVLPSKIVVYGEHPDNKIKESLQSFSWMSQLPFLHLPKIELLGEEMVLDAICFAGASEINPHVAFHPKHVSAGEGSHKRSLVSPLDDEEESLPHHTRRGHHMEAAAGVANITAVDADDGFISGDVAEEVHRKDTARFALDEDMPQTHNLPAKRRAAEIDDFEDEFPEPHTTSHHKAGFMASMMAMLPFGVGGGSAHHTGGAGQGIKGLLTNKFVIVAFLVLVGLGAAFVFVPKAKVDVFIDMQTMQKDSTIVADPAITSVDEANRKIPGTVVDAQVEGELKGTASGKKQVGEPAKGTVIVYNKTNSPRTFNAGTIITVDNLQFTLDSNVQVASQSAFDSGISFGKATVNATAVAIGPDGNLAAGKELNIKDQSYDNYYAKVDQAFSGGVSKDVTVVTAEDQRKLLAQVSAELRTKAREQIQAKLNEQGLKIIEEGLTEQIVSQAYSKKVGDQATDFTLEMVSKYKGTAYNETELKGLVSKLLDTNVPEGFELDVANSETQSEISKVEKDGKLVFTAKFKAKLKPKIDLEALKKQIAGQPKNKADEKLREIGNVIGTEIQLTPNLPAPLDILPFMSNNITIEVTAK